MSCFRGIMLLPWLPTNVMAQLLVT